MTGRSPGQHPPPSWLEWAARIVSVALVAGLVLYVVADGLAATTPPTFEYSIDRGHIERRAAGWVVPATVTNTGSVSVSAVGITMELTAPDGSPAGSETVTVDLLGRGGEIDVEFVFDTDPRLGTIALAVDGYQVP